MICQYVFCDVGNRNILKLIKYSILHLRSTFNRMSQFDSVELDYVRPLGHYVGHDILSLEKLCTVTQSTFHDSVSINQGYPFCNILRFCEIYEKFEEPRCYISPTLFVNRSFELDENCFYLYESDSIWWNVPWAFLEKGDAEEFVNHFTKEGVLSQKFDDYKMYRNTFFYAPQKYASELKTKMSVMLDYISNLYKAHYPYRAACTCAEQIVLSMVVSDICNRNRIPLKLIASDPVNKDRCIRYKSETEADVAGSLRILF